MNDRQVRPRRRVLAGTGKSVAAGTLALALTMTITPVAQALNETLTISLTATTGTPNFDANDFPGNDSSPTNNIIRTNDYAVYSIEVSANGGNADNAYVKLELPKGQELREVPAHCKDASGNPAVVTPAMVAPAVPLTATSWQSLPAQTVECHLPQILEGQTRTLTFPVFQRVEVPHGTVLAAAKASVRSDFVTTPVQVTHATPMVVSASPKWDLRKVHSTVVQGANAPGFGYSYNSYRQCSWDANLACNFRSYPILIGTPNGGKGTSPLLGTVSFTEDLTPANFYGSAVVNHPTWIAAGANANNMYAPRLYGCEKPQRFHLSPGNTTDMTESVRNTGTVSCSQPAPGQAATVNISGADWSLYTYPSTVASPANKPPIADNTAYAASAVVHIEIPMAAVTAFGTVSGGEHSLLVKNEFKNLLAAGLNGALQGASVDPQWNNFVNAYARRTTPGGFTKHYAGIGGDLNNTAGASYRPGDPVAEGPPGSTVVRDGFIPAGPGQTVISLLQVDGSSLGNRSRGAALLCDAWDNNRLHLHKGNWGASATMAGQQRASGGEAVWLSGVTQNAPDPASVIIEYSGDTASGSGAGSNCRGGTWVTDPATLSGNDPTLAAQGIYTAVNKVRIYTTVEKPANNATNITRVFYSIALRVAPGQNPGDILPNWASANYRFVVDPQPVPTQAELLALANPGSAYDPATNSGNIGDRLLYAPAFVRVEKKVSRNGGAYHDNVSASAGDVLEWRLTPKLSSSAPANNLGAQPVYLEDCLPEGLIYDSASYNSAVLTPLVAQLGAPPNAGIGCGATDMYLKFYVGDHSPNTVIPGVIVKTRVSAVAGPGTRTNVVAAQTDPVDPSAVAVRSDNAQVTISQIAEMKVEKSAITPVVQVNPAGNATLQENIWQIDVYNGNSSGVTNPDFIDVLPSADGVNGSDFTGTMSFRGVQVTAGGPGVRVLYTAAATVHPDPNDASNHNATGIAWCSAPAGGTLVSGTGACPASADQVTGLRFQRPGAFNQGDRIGARITMVAEGNAHGDTYVNVIKGRAQGALNFLIAAPPATERAIGATVGDTVWYDQNADGLQNTGEPGVKKFTVRITGTDDLGNPVDRTTQTGETGVSGITGKYSFPNLRAGDYRVTFEPANFSASGVLPGWRFTSKYQGSDSSADSNGDPVTGISDQFTLLAGMNRSDLDQGVVYDLAEIGRVMWIDANRNGVQDPGEAPVPNMTIRLLGADHFGNAVNLVTTTDANGHYLFANLVPGEYYLALDLNALPAGYRFVQAGAGGNPALDSDVNPLTGKTRMLKLSSGQSLLSIGIGIERIPGWGLGLVNTGTTLPILGIGAAGLSLLIGAGLLLARRKRQRAEA